MGRELCFHSESAQSPKIMYVSMNADSEKHRKKKEDRALQVYNQEGKLQSSVTQKVKKQRIIKKRIIR